MMRENRDGRVDAPVRCGTLREIVASGGGAWAERGERESMVYPLPEHASGEARDYLRGLAAATGPERGAAWLEAGRVYGEGVVLSADGATLARDVSADFGKGPHEHWLLGQGRLKAPAESRGVTAVVAVNRGAGYCHWLLEELPRLLTLRTGKARNVVAHATGEWAREAWSRRGGGETLVAARRSTHLEAAPLVVPGLVAEAGAPTAEACALVREFAGSGAGGGAGEKIYVSRAKAGRRRVANEDEVWRELEERGFARVFLEELAWAEQVAIFRAARVVAGAHGAGLANLVFCAPGARVVELVNRAYFNPTFWRLAALGGLDYRPVVTAGEGPIREDRKSNREDIEADVAGMRAALEGA